MRHKGVSYAKYGYIFCIPFMLAYLIFHFYPTIYTAFIGFTNLKGVIRNDVHVLDNIFENFELILNNPSFQVSVKNTLIIWILNFIPQILLALFLTAIFTRHRNKLKGQGAFKVLFYMPNIITAATIALLFSTFFGYPMGPVNSIFEKLGFIDKPVYFLMSGLTAKGVVAFVQFWMWYGSTMIILISGVLGINPELFEAAEIDGASNVKTFFYVTLPNLRTILIFTLVTSMIGGLNMFDIPRMFLDGGPDNATLTASLFIYHQSFSGSYMYNRAAAASMIMFFVIVIFSAFIFFIMRDKNEVMNRKLDKMRTKEFRKAQKAAKGVAE